MGAEDNQKKEEKESADSNMSELIKNVTKTIDQYNNYGIELLKKMVSLKTVSSDMSKKQVKTIISFLSDILKKCGFSVQIIESCGYKNIYATYSHGKGPHIILNGHYDVADDSENWAKYYPKIKKIKWCGKEREVLYGKGSNDMKAGLVAIILAARSLIENNAIKGKLSLLIVGDEETGGKHGTCHCLNLITSREQVDYAIVGEPTNGGIVTKRRGLAFYSIKFPGEKIPLEKNIATYRIRFRGISVHNAHITREDPHALYDLADIVKDISQKIKLYSYSLQGGNAPNTAPAYIDWVVSVGKKDEDKFNMILNNKNLEFKKISPVDNYKPGINYLLEAVHKLRYTYFPHARGSNYGISVGPNLVNDIRLTLDIRVLFSDIYEIDRTLQRLFESYNARIVKVMFAKPLNESEKSDLVATLDRYARKFIFWRKHYIQENPGQSDSRFFAEKGIPVCEVGTAGGNIHGKDEYVILDSIVNVAKTIASALIELMNEK